MNFKRNLIAFMAAVIVFFLTITIFVGCKSDPAPAFAVETEAALTTESTASVNGQENAAAPVSGGIFRAYIHEPVSLDPPNAYESEGIQVIKQVWDGLFDYDPETLETIPSICETFDVSDDGLVYTFYLKKGVLFHSGRELVAEDFVYSWTRVALKDTASYLAYHLDPILGFAECQEGTADTLAGVKALDDYTLEVTLSYPYADFINTLGHSVFYPIAREDIEKYGDAYGENINGTGPFKFVKWEHDQYIDLVRNDDYYGNKAYLDEVRYVIMADENTAFLEFQAGNLEFTMIPLGQIESTLADPSLKDGVIIKPLQALYYYGMNVDTEPFKDNLALREAINYILDREYICNSINEGVPSPATGFVPPGIIGFAENAMDFRFDMEKAAQKLEEAGYPNGEGLPTLKLGYNIGAGHEQIAEAFQLDAKEIGINIEIEGYEWGTMLEKAQSGEINFYRLGWLADYPTMDNFLYPLFHSKSADNYAGYVNPDVDKMLEEARQTMNQEERIAKYREIEKKILREAIFAPIYYYGMRRIVQPYVKGFVIDSTESYDLSKVYLETN
jgi:oligopeptide transport system substrate-binding protein